MIDAVSYTHLDVYKRQIIQYIYETAFEKNNMGYGAAMSYVLFIIIAALSALQLKHSGKEEKK